MMRRFGLTLMTAVAVLAAAAGPVWAQACHGGASFDRWLAAFKQEAAAQGISRATLAAAEPYLTFDPGIVRKDRGQGVFQQTFLEFAGRMSDTHRVPNGLAKIKANAALLARVEQEFGVPGPVVVAFWGLETDFGINSGTLPVLRSLVTLAYDCRRPEMFREELMYGLRILERGDMTAAQMQGAWAGEIGQTQFSPSAYFKYAVDYDGDGRRDLIRSAPDVVASTANLLAKEGWQRGQPWLHEVRVPANLPWEQADVSIKHPRSQWARWGVRMADDRPLPNDGLPASLVLPMGRFGPAFLAYKNFDVFLEWNASLVYATTAAYHATRLAGAPKVGRGSGAPPSLSAQQITELQRLLAQEGHQVGKIDGKIGLGTRAAVRAAQVKLGLPADSYPTAELISRLRTVR
jgi:lytic murein transglycosylase